MLREGQVNRVDGVPRRGLTCGLAWRVGRRSCWLSWGILAQRAQHLYPAVCLNVIISASKEQTTQKLRRFRHRTLTRNVRFERMGGMAEMKNDKRVPAGRE